MTLRNAFDAVATETTLAALNTKAATAIVDLPTQNTPALPIRQAPMKYFDVSFSQVGAGLLSPEFTLIRTGTGQTVNQSNGGLVITAGTTANAETVIRSVASFNGALTLKHVITLSQRILQNNFTVELVDVLGDNLAYNIVNTTTVDVTLNNHGFTAANVGQTIDLVALSSVGTPVQAVIASIPNANTIRFTVAGWPATGSGTLSLTGWNKIECNHTTNNISATFNTRRRGWQNTAVTVNTNVTSAPGLMVALSTENGVVSFADKLTTSVGVLANRNSWDTNVPTPETELFIQIRVTNGSSGPATSTTCTFGMFRVEDYIPTQVSLTSTRQQTAQNSLPVSTIGTTTVAGTVTATLASTTITSGTITLSAPAAVADVASAALTTTTTTAAITPTAGTSYTVNIPVTVVSGTTPTLDVGVEESDDTGTNWFRVYDFPRITATGSYRSPPLVLRGNRIRYVQTVGGTTPSFTRAINRLQRSDDAILRVSFIDRTIVPNTLNSATPAYFVEGCSDFNFLVRCTAQTTAATITVQFSHDGTNWHTTGNTLTTVNGIAHVKVQNEQWKFSRLIVTAAGTGITLGEAMITGRSA